MATGGGDPLSNHHLVMAATEALDLQGKGKGKGKFSPPPGLSRRTPKLQNAKFTVHLQNAEDQGKGAQLTPPTIDTTEAPTTEAPTIDTTEAPTTEAPTVDTTEAPTTEAPTIEAADEEHEDDWLLMTA